jgi:hypothetical protein
MFVLLMILTILLVLLLVITLVAYLTRILKVLSSIGGNGRSYLSKLRLGLRAIEQETGHLPAEAGRLNETLEATAEGLKAVDNNLISAIDAISKQQKA